MKSDINLKTTSLLLKRYFVENTYREIMFWSIMVFIFTIFDQRDFVQLVIVVGGLIFSSNLFKELWNSPSGIHYFMIPTTQAEKITVAILLNTFYFFAMSIFAYFIGHFLIVFVYHLILKIEIPLSWDLFQATKTIFVNGKTYVSIENEFWKILGNFAFIQALSLVGSLYFKKNTTIKTIFSFVVFVILLGIIQILLMKLFLGDINIVDSMVYLNIAFNNPKFPIYIQYTISIISYLVIPYLWLVGYFKFTEKQL